MSFITGDRVRNTMREREGVVLGFETETLALVDYGQGPEKASVRNLTLLAPKHTKQTREERLRRAELVSEDFLDYLRLVGVSIRVYCAEEHVGLLVHMLE